MTQTNGDRWLILVPAYGRDYQNPEEVLLAWRTLADFRIQDVSSSWSGCYINRQDAERHGTGERDVVDLRGVTFKIRYNHLQDFALIHRVGNAWELVDQGDETEESED